MNYKGFLKNIKKGSLSTVTASDIFVVEKPELTKAQVFDEANTFTVSPSTIPATQADHVPQFGQTLAATGTGTVLSLNKVAGTNYNYTTPSSATTYTTVTPIINGYASCKINAPTEPTITGATKIKGATFAANIDMEMIVESKDGINVRYFFLEL